jgi:hypothetical protein
MRRLVKTSTAATSVVSLGSDRHTTALYPTPVAYSRPLRRGNEGSGHLPPDAIPVEYIPALNVRLFGCCPPDTHFAAGGPRLSPQNAGSAR